MTLTVEAEAHKEKGNILFKQGRYEEAVGEYKAAIAIDALVPAYWSNLAASMEKLGQHDEMAQAARGCIQADATFIQGYFRLAVALQKLDHYEDCIQTCEQGLAMYEAQDAADANSKKAASYLKGLQKEVQKSLRPSRTIALPCLDPPTVPSPPQAWSKSSPTEQVVALKKYIGRIEAAKLSYEDEVDKTAMQLRSEIQAIYVRRDRWMEQADQALAKARVDLKQQTFLAGNADKLQSLTSKMDQSTCIDGIPNQLRCPITLQLMKDPVVAADGNTYEKSALEDWFNKNADKNGFATSPLTGARLANRKYVPSFTIKSMCEVLSSKP